MRSVLSGLAVFVVLGCSDGFLPPTDVRGTWAADFSIPGAALQFNLDGTNQLLSGNGSYAIEAGPAGTLQVSGSYDRPAIALVLHYDSGRNLTYTGVVEDNQHMTGTIADSLGQKSTLTFTRQ